MKQTQPEKLGSYSDINRFSINLEMHVWFFKSFEQPSTLTRPITSKDNLKMVAIKKHHIYTQINVNQKKKKKPS